MEFLIFFSATNSKSKIHNCLYNLQVSQLFFSQYNQDQYIYEKFFKDKNSGTYVDIGAYDGKTLSNTLFFDNLGWKGYCFEPLPEVYKQLVINRPKAQNFNVAIGHENKTVEFLKIDGYAEMLSGVLDYYNAEHLFRINHENYQNNGSVDAMDVELKTLDKVISPFKQIDYLSIDTEGGEDIILSNILDNFEPYVISVEVNYQKDLDQIVNLIQGKYNFDAMLGCDLILVRI